MTLFKYIYILIYLHDVSLTILISSAGNSLPLSSFHSKQYKLKVPHKNETGANKFLIEERFGLASG